MVRNEISQKVGQEVSVRGRVSVPWNGHRVAWCVENIVVDGEIPIDHSWIQIPECSEEVCELGRNVRRGDIVEFRAVVGKYYKKGGVVDYNFREVEV
jgi:hypothetical protein